MHLQRRPGQFFKLFAGNAASLALVAIKVKTFLTFAPPRGTCVVGVVGHGGTPLGERLAKHTIKKGAREGALDRSLFQFDKEQWGKQVYMLIR